MKAVAFNGSPRKNKNTAQLLEAALNGAKENGAETELIHLYDYQLKGCRSCFECKRIGGKNYGQCAIRDEMQPLIEKARQADILLLGTPLYFGNATAQLRAFLERLLFPPLVYDKERSNLWGRPVRVGLIYTMNCTDDLFEPAMQLSLENFVSRCTGCEMCEKLEAHDTYQFSDYSKYYAPSYDVEHKIERRDVQFPIELEKAYALGQKLTQ